MDEIKQISIVNSEYGKPFNLYVRSDRLKAFYQFMIDERHPERKSDPMPGASWAVVLGLDAIFARRPKKFPVDDILLWLASGIIPHPDFPRVTKTEVEYALERFSAMYPPDASEDA
jgi:hypothetical protein